MILNVMVLNINAKTNKDLINYLITVYRYIELGISTLAYYLIPNCCVYEQIVESNK